MTKWHKAPIKAGMKKGELILKIVFWPTYFLTELYEGPKNLKQGIFPLALLWMKDVPYKSQTGSFW